MTVTKKDFVARAIYHHSQRTSEFVTLSAYKDANDSYELLDNREPVLEFEAGTRKYILDQWGKRNRNLIRDGFQRDNLAGDNEFQQFIS